MVTCFRRSAFIFINIIFGCAGNAQDQRQPVKFVDPCFDKVLVTKNLVYSEKAAASIKANYYRFDLYEPKADSALVRPLIIWLHGGGFKFGKKKSGGIPLWSKTFALRGYVCAAINYRLSKKHPLKNFADLAEGCADAADDLNMAIHFLKQHCGQYRIDTNRIIVGGNSAGGMIALQSVYSTHADIAKLIHRGDSTTQSTYNPQHIAAVINYWGALFSTDWLSHARVPIVSAHGSRDRVVPCNDKKSPLIGSCAIHAIADSLGIANDLKVFDGCGHELQKHFNPLFAGRAAKQRWLAAGQFAADFLYTALFRQ